MKCRSCYAGVILGFVTIIGAGSMVQSAYAAGAASALRALDPDHDGTVDLSEAKSAASKMFDRLDRDHDGTLDRRELKGRLTEKQFTAADPDHDGTLDKDEYLAVVEKHFNMADPDSDGTVDVKELNSPAGRALLRLVK
jgi:Ca2+-binding EF-hand superfamily protein